MVAWKGLSSGEIRLYKDSGIFRFCSWWLRGHSRAVNFGMEQSLRGWWLDAPLDTLEVASQNYFSGRRVHGVNQSERDEGITVQFMQCAESPEQKTT